MAKLLFALFSLVSVGSVLAMILSRSAAAAALWLALGFSALGGLFGLLGAPFAAVAQIIVYAGAIMVLFLFVLMTIDARTPWPRHRRRAGRIAAVGLGLILTAEIAAALMGRIRSPASGPAASVKTAELGRLLFDKYLYPFEITSLLIMAALVGAVVLVKGKDRP
jgi:NADH-quinone oxidoreductase subunit J